MKADLDARRGRWHMATTASKGGPHQARPRAACRALDTGWWWTHRVVLGALAARLGTKPVIEVLRQADDGRDALAQVLDLDVVDASPRPEPRRPMSSNREAGLRSTVPRAPPPRRRKHAAVNRSPVIRPRALHRAGEVGRAAYLPAAVLREGGCRTAWCRARPVVGSTGTSAPRQRPGFAGPGGWGPSPLPARPRRPCRAPVLGLPPFVPQTGVDARRHPLPPFTLPL